MNELDRQTYLSAFGIENYMPRLLLAASPDPVACVLPVSLVQRIESASINDQLERSNPQDFSAEPIQMVTDVLASMRDSTSNISKSSSLPDEKIKLKPFVRNDVRIVQPFTLSVWRPVPGLLVVDARNSQLALPTELLLRNLLKGVFFDANFKLNEEVLRWPMIENSFVSRTENDARNELQTWLAVEHELRPIERLWLMGKQAAHYLLASDMSYEDALWQLTSMANKDLTALVLPGLNEFLLQPAMKARLWQCLV